MFTLMSEAENAIYFSPLSCSRTEETNFYHRYFNCFFKVKLYLNCINF